MLVGGRRWICPGVPALGEAVPEDMGRPHGIARSPGLRRRADSQVARQLSGEQGRRLVSVAGPSRGAASRLRQYCSLPPRLVRSVVAAPRRSARPRQGADVSWRSDAVGSDILCRVLVKLTQPAHCAARCEGGTGLGYVFNRVEHPQDTWRFGARPYPCDETSLGEAY